MAIRHVGTEMVKTPPAVAALADRLVNVLARTPGDRPFSQQRYDAHKAAAYRGLFWYPSWVEARVAGNDPPFRVNGNHTSRLAFDHPGLIKQVAYSKFECDTMADLAELYGTFDNANNGRTNVDVAAAMLTTLLPAVTLPRRMAAPTVSGVILALDTLHEWGKGPPVPRRLPIIDRVHLVALQPWFLQIVADEFSAETAKTAMHRAPVIAAMFLTMQRPEFRDAALLFWRQVRDGSNLPPQSPPLVLRDYLLQHSLGTGDSRKMAVAREMLSKCMTVWRRRGEKTVGKLIAKTNKIPLVVGQGPRAATSRPGKARKSGTADEPVAPVDADPVAGDQAEW